MERPQRLLVHILNVPELIQIGNPKTGRQRLDSASNLQPEGGGDNIGFERTLEEYGGDWAMAKYIEATEMHDERERDRVMDEILKYNEEDLAATWAVFRWLKTYV